MLRSLLRTCVHRRAAFFQSIEASTRSDEYFRLAVHVCADAAHRPDGPRISWWGTYSGVGPFRVSAHLVVAASALVYLGGGLHGQRMLRSNANYPGGVLFPSL